MRYNHQETRREAFLQERVQRLEYEKAELLNEYRALKKHNDGIDDMRHQLFDAINQKNGFARQSESYRKKADWILDELTKFNALPWYKKMFHKWDIQICY